MTAVADDEVLRAAELDLSVDEPGTMEPADADTDAGTESTAGPIVRILRGAPTDDEIAALVSVLAAAAASSADIPGPQGPIDQWGRPTLMHRSTSPFSPYAFPHLSHARD